MKSDSEAFIMLQKVSILDKYCSLKLSIPQINKNSLICTKI